jgi:hypothetical protein
MVIRFGAIPVSSEYAFASVGDEAKEAKPFQRPAESKPVELGMDRMAAIQFSQIPPFETRLPSESGVGDYRLTLTYTW